MNLIADTNVWYDISEGTRTPRNLKACGNRLVATPISVLEIVSGITKDNFAQRKNAVRAILDHADEITEDSESHLVSLGALKADRPEFAWKDVLLAVSQASFIDELQTGVPDPTANVKRTIDLEFLKQWRSTQWSLFKQDIEEALDQHIPGYGAARASGQRAKIVKALKEPYKTVLRSDEFKRFVIGAVFQRALMAAEQPFREPTQEEGSRGEQLLSPYANAYIEYVIGCGTEFAPDSNDLGDSESFLYLQGDNRFLSRDKRWVTIGRRACPSYVHDPEENIPE
jgi:predicted nucleic acid-binding protein